MRVQLGSEQLFDNPVFSGLLAGKRVGVVSNPASIDGSFAHIVDRVAARRDTRLAALFGPQHGFRSDVQENMIETDHARDERRRLPVYSLYSETRQPTPEMLEGLDLLVIDLQDVGTRIYTYIYTMANCLIAARRHGLPVIVCDRPNPIGGVAIEGPMLVPGFESFVGMYPIPMRHGMTIGELAILFNAHFGIGAALTVVPMQGWQRPMYFDETGVPWVMPSPNLPTLDGAVVYPGTVLFEGTSVSEGRGTTRPFELVGAPRIDAEAFADRMNRLGLPGVYFRPAVFEPTFHKHAKQTCGGCQIHVRDRTTFEPVLAGAALTAAFRAMDPDGFRWREPPYEYEHIKLPFDILAGSTELREQIEAGVPAADIRASWTAGAAAFAALREPYLLY
ncbi:MAG: exo-beta-N-acetylmuramidase NamZ domain-containing protein [Vicinamibacterales bacterium]